MTMVRQLLPISALLLGSALLLFAGGMNSLILPVRGSAEGFSALSLGLLGTGWAIGYVLGCWWTPRLVGRVGHVRSFGVMSSFAAATGRVGRAIPAFVRNHQHVAVQALAGPSDHGFHGRTLVTGRHDDQATVTDGRRFRQRMTCLCSGLRIVSVSHMRGAGFGGPPGWVDWPSGQAGP